MPSATRRSRQTFDIWPGFVDALSALLIIIIFLLMVFTLAQFFLGELLSGRNQALDRLNRQVAELTNMLSIEKNTNLTLRGEIFQLTSDLNTSNTTRDSLSSQLAELLPQKDALEAMLEDIKTERETLQIELNKTLQKSSQMSVELEDAQKTIRLGEDKIKAKLTEITQLNRDLNALREIRKNLETKIAELANAVKARDKALTALRDKSKELEAKLSTEQERTALAQKNITKKELTIRELGLQAKRIGEELTEEQRMNAEALKQIKILNLQLAVVRQKLATLNATLEDAEEKARKQDVQIVNLGKRLNAALSNKVAELALYRSEFFGRLRQALGNRRGFKIVGDRFVFQSEVLFSSASADLNIQGQNQIAQLARTLNEISDRIPQNLNWVLRVDGHTDRRPIKTLKFPSNWELSSARAIAVVRELISHGVKAKHLVAAGFGEFQPIDPRNDEIADRRNRRIEFKLTQR